MSRIATPMCYSVTVLQCYSATVQKRIIQPKNNRKQKSNCSTVATATLFCLFLILVDMSFACGGVSPTRRRSSWLAITTLRFA